MMFYNCNQDNVVISFRKGQAYIRLSMFHKRMSNPVYSWFRVRHLRFKTFIMIHRCQLQCLTVYKKIV